MGSLMPEIYPRPSVAAIDAILGEPFRVLDHGFVRVIDYMGDDTAIVQAARVSYGEGTKSVQDDAGLIDYLMRRRHSSPFEHCEIKLHVKLPIFVARQWIRHRTANVSEISARYSVLPDEFYLPAPEDIARQSDSNKQGRGDALGGNSVAAVTQVLRDGAGRCYDDYGELLDTGLARELARISLPLSAYTQWYWKIDLHNLFHFLQLRLDPHAQLEIRRYAEVIAGIVRQWVPLAWAAFVRHRLDAVTLSGPAVALVKRMLAGERPSQEDSGLGRREYEDVMRAMGVAR